MSVVSSEHEYKSELSALDEKRIKEELINKPEIISSLLHEEPIKQLFVAQYREFFSGPLPPPKILSGYENILPGAAERVFLLTEQQAIHRQAYETRMLDSEIEQNKEILKQEYLKNQFGFICALLLMLLIFYAIYKENSPVAVALIGIIIGLVTVFVLGKRTTKEQNDGS